MGYQGQIWPVNPRRDTMRGHECYAFVDDLPSPLDADFLAVPPVAAIAATARLVEVGAGGIVCYTLGFREAGAGGAALVSALVAATGDLGLVGLSCYRVLNYLDRAAMWPFVHGGTCPGYGVAMITSPKTGCSVPASPCRSSACP